MMLWQGSRELLAPPITVNGQPTDGLVEFALVTDGAMPTTWAAATVIDGKPGYLLAGTEPPGRYALWVRITDNPEIPILRTGRVYILGANGAPASPPAPPMTEVSPGIWEIA